MKAEYKEGKEASEKNANYLETHLAKYKYIEGPKATENFKRLARTVFQARKTVALATPKKQASRKKRGKDEA